MSDEQPDKGQDELALSEAARILGITPEAIRKRIQRGDMVGEKRGGRWYVRLSNRDRTALQPGQDGALGELRARVASLEGQLEAKDRQIGELHVILARLDERLPQLSASPVLPQPDLQPSGQEQDRHEDRRPWFRRLFDALVP